MTNPTPQLPGWESLPNFALYRDQVIDIVTSAFPNRRAEDILTPSMINNYVKWHLVEKPVKKKYERTQIAQFFILTLFKRIMSLQEIKEFMDSHVARLGVEGLYERIVFLLNHMDALLAADGTVDPNPSLFQALPYETQEEDLFCTVLGLYYVERGQALRDQRRAAADEGEGES